MGKKKQWVQRLRNKVRPGVFKLLFENFLAPPRYNPRAIVLLLVLVVLVLVAAVFAAVIVPV